MAAFLVSAACWADEATQALATPRQQPFVISTDFSNPKTDINDFSNDRGGWEISDGVLKTVDGISRSLSFAFGEAGWQDYEIEFKVKRLEVNPKDQHFSLFVRQADNTSLRFYCRGDSVRYIENVGGREVRHGLLGNLPTPMRTGKDAPWTSFRVKVTGDQAKLYVDAALIGTVSALVPKNGAIMFFSYQLNLCLDDVKVVVSRTTNALPSPTMATRNILRNSSFEQCTLDRLPDYWGCAHWGITDPYWITHYDEWVESYGVDTGFAYDGARSMRISNPFDKKDNSGLCLRSTCAGTKIKEKYTFSAYMRSHPKGMKVSFIGKELELTDEWRRHSGTFVNDGSSMYADMINVYPLSKGTFWIDAAQLEEGEVLTPYQPSRDSTPLQTQEGNQEKVVSAVPRCETKRLEGPVELNGTLRETVWEKADKLELVNINGAPAMEKTEARIWYDDEGIYIGVKCLDENMEGNECKALEREGCVWNDPSVELFIDPNLTRNYYYHLGFNQKGVQFDAFCGDISWNGTWRVATHTGEKYWSAEVFLPFGEMGIDRGTGEWWGLNICRGNSRKKEYSCWSPTYASFHTPERFGQIHIDRETLKSYFFGCGGAEFQRMSGGKVLLSVTMSNDSGKDGEFFLAADLKDAQGIPVATFEQPVRLGGTESRAIILGEVVGQPETKYLLHLTIFSKDKKKVCYSGNRYLEMTPYFTLTPQYDLYTTEQEMMAKVFFSLTDDDLEGARLRLEIRGKDGNAVLKKEATGLEREMDVRIELADVPPGAYRLKAVLHDKSGKALADWEGKFRKMAPVPHETKVDHLARMIVVDGKPFMPLGFAWEGKLTTEVLAYLAANGCNIISFHPRLGDDVETMRVLDDSLKLGMKIKMNVSAKEKDKAVEQIERFKTHPAIIAWDIFDEVFTGPWGKDNYQFVSDRCVEMKEIDPYRPVYINENQYGLTYLQSKNLDFPGDIVSIDYYAWPPSCNLQVTGDYVKTMRAMGRKNGRPSWIYLLGAGYAFCASRDYTPAEQEFSTYTSVINGASGIFYWASHPKSKSQWERIKGLFRELRELTPVIASTRNVPLVKCASPSIQFLTKSHDNAVYLIAVNSSKEPATARFDLSSLKLSGAEASADTLFEGRQAAIKDGVLEDTFGGFQRHVYKIGAPPEGRRTFLGMPLPWW